MKRIVTGLVAGLVLLLGGSTCVVAQSLDVEHFLQGVAAHPVGDQAEQDHALELVQALNLASPAEVEEVLPVLLQYSRPGKEIRARLHSALLINSIAIRPDGADLLSSKAEDLSALLVDADPRMQKVAVYIADYLIGRPSTNNKPYISALAVAIQNPQTPQDACVNGIVPLLTSGGGDPSALRAAVEFVHRDDLTAATRTELVHELPDLVGLPEQVSQYLVNRLDDPDLHVRAMALVSYSDSIVKSRALADEQKHPDPRFGPDANSAMAAEAVLDSKTAFHILAKDRVERMAHDPHEDPRIRALAKQALTGKPGLSPNYDLPPVKPITP